MALHIPDSGGRRRAGGPAAGSDETATILESVAPHELRSAARGDAERVTGALRRALEAENQFRSIVDEAQPGKMQEAASRFGKVPYLALSGTADPVEQAAIIGQLDQGMAFHEDRLAMRALKDRAQELQQLREERMSGMLRDAAEAGGMAGMTLSPELQQRALRHFSNTLLSMEQTFRSTGQTLGESSEVTGQRIKTTRSGMTGAFLARMADENPVHARALLGQLEGTLEERDLDRSREAVNRAFEDHAFSTLEERYRQDGTVDYDTALQNLLDVHDMPDLEDSHRQVVQERLEVANARQAYQKSKDDETLRKKTFEDFYNAVDGGDVQAAHNLLDKDTVLGDGVRKRMRDSLKADKWETRPDVLFKTVDDMRRGKIEDAYTIIPGRDLSHSDASALRNLLQKRDPRSDLENRMFYRGVETVLERMEGAKPERRAEAVRTLFSSLTDARNKGGDPIMLFTPGKEGNLIDSMVWGYGTGTVDDRKVMPEHDGTEGGRENSMPQYGGPADGMDERFYRGGERSEGSRGNNEARGWDDLVWRAGEGEEVKAEFLPALHNGTERKEKPVEMAGHGNA
ncbi:hypothetical protein N1030_17590 [Desulfovibrio mangrovi]|uniref:hypothetical protein n=1 Tax=Desulfovibrio mangrovi TaxID=2976983 RepID=UPI0022471EF0|nr:hypothetical protein [Desulfovibrio mangrovi]UZP67386.1 hypothetical protein N1030_17590 [Desulfovibrio mangrovi]